MNDFPHVAKGLDLLTWVAANPNKPFDPSMIVSLSTGHTSDWEWQAVQGQMEDLKIQGYITRVRQDASGSTYWTITAKGEKYLHALRSFEQTQEIARLYPQSSTKLGGAEVTLLGGWEQLKPLGEGGQSKVFLVRSPRRAEVRRTATQDALKTNPWAPYIGGNPSEQVDRVDRLATSLLSYARPDDVSELGALKMFKFEESGKGAEEAAGRLKNEITVLNQKRPGLLKLLDANEKERWVVTEYMPGGTLDTKPTTYRGDALRALKAFKSLVETVAGLHKDGYVHRDVKPANVFLAGRDRLVLGDFGIVFVPDQSERLTVTDERVGPRDYMPQWADLGKRLENVHTNFDVYMLGKFLWCMATGRLRLPREYHQRPAYDIKILFPNDPSMHSIDTIIRQCVVEEPDHCLRSAVELLSVVDEQLVMLDRGGQLLTEGVPRPCRICGIGFYQQNMFPSTQPALPKHGPLGLRFWLETNEIATVPVHGFVCDNCGHIELFTRSSPGL